MYSHCAEKNREGWFLGRKEAPQEMSHRTLFSGEKKVQCGDSVARCGPIPGPSRIRTLLEGKRVMAWVGSQPSVPHVAGE